jgi:hypothetical protein
MATAPERLGLYGPPDRKASLIAISNAIFTIEYQERLTMAQIGAEVDVDAETIENAKYQRNLLNFVTIARLLARWPDHCAEVRQLWEMLPREPETHREKIARLVRELTAAIEEEK